MPFGNYYRITIRNESACSTTWRSRPSGCPIPVAITATVQNRFCNEIRRISSSILTGNVIPGETDGIVGRIYDIAQIVPDVILVIITTANILSFIGSDIVLFINVAMAYRQTAEPFRLYTPIISQLIIVGIVNCCMLFIDGAQGD